MADVIKFLDGQGNLLEVYISVMKKLYIKLENEDYMDESVGIELGKEDAKSLLSGLKRLIDEMD